MQPTKLSFVMPVRDREGQIAARVQRVLDGLVDLAHAGSEIVVVDDGSRDATPEILEVLQSEYPRLRVVRHDRPRGIEAAGQTGLERASNELVFIQESDSDPCLDDLLRLLRISKDETIVAARVESSETPIAPSLLRRLREWGTDADEQVTIRIEPVRTRTMQMIRRPHLQRLTGPDGKRYQLEGQTERIGIIQQHPQRPLERSLDRKFCDFH
jgi:glycosyltransferase involved in cell wall biosynthesis